MRAAPRKNADSLAMSVDLKITGVCTRILCLPLAKPIVTATVTATDVWFLVVELRTDSGAAGHAYIWSYNAPVSRCIKEMVAELSRHVVGADPRQSAQIWSRMWKGTVQWGHAGITIMATAVIDSAVWDLVGAVTGQSIGHLLGLRKSSVPTYASHGLWISNDFEALQREASGYLEQGFRAMKMRIGRERIEDDVRAVREVRAAIGSDAGLMVDFGSAPTRERAERMSRAMEDFNLLWIEDPIADEDPREHAELAKKIRTPICFGEKVYAPQGFARLIEERAADHLMADLQRAGGVTAWVRIAALADAARLPLSTHILPELNVHLAASAPTGAWLEYLPWGEPLFEDRLTLVAGEFQVPERPGFGLKFDQQQIKRSLQDEEVFSK